MPVCIKTKTLWMYIILAGMSLRAGRPMIFPGYYEHEHGLLLQDTKRKWDQKNFLAVQYSPPTKCIYLATFSDSPVLVQDQGNELSTWL